MEFDTPMTPVHPGRTVLDAPHPPRSGRADSAPVAVQRCFRPSPRTLLAGGSANLLRPPASFEPTPPPKAGLATAKKPPHQNAPPPAASSFAALWCSAARRLQAGRRPGPGRARSPPGSPTPKCRDPAAGTSPSFGPVRRPGRPGPPRDALCRIRADDRQCPPRGLLAPPYTVDGHARSTTFTAAKAAWRVPVHRSRSGRTA